MKVRAARLATAALAVTAGLVAVAPPGHAVETTVSATVTGGNLTISAPSSASLGSGTATTGSVLSADLGDVTVQDSRGSLLGWTVSAATTTNSMSTGGSNPDTIPLGSTGPLSWVTGAIIANGSSLLTGLSAGVGGFLNTSAVEVARAAAGAGGGSYTYSPTVSLTVPPNTKAGTYSVVVSQTVA